jgi:hypothetical protein
MTDLLTQRLHASAERIPVTLRPASETRRAAEHARRVRRAVFGTLVGAVVVAVAVALGAGVAGGLRSEPTPAITPTPSPTPGGHALASDPLITEDVWAAKLANVGYGTPTRVVTQDTDTLLMECIGDPRSLGAAELHSATYHWPGGGLNTEFVMLFDNEASSIRAFADLQSRFVSCHPQQRGRPFIYAGGNIYVDPAGPIDDMFEGEGDTTANDQAMGLTAGHYDVGAAREGNVVVVMESYGGWGDRPAYTLDTMMDAALGPDWRLRG